MSILLENLAKRKTALEANIQQKTAEYNQLRAAGDKVMTELVDMTGRLNLTKELIAENTVSEEGSFTTAPADAAKIPDNLAISEEK